MKKAIINLSDKALVARSYEFWSCKKLFDEFPESIAMYTDYVIATTKLHDYISNKAIDNMDAMCPEKYFNLIAMLIDSFFNTIESAEENFKKHSMGKFDEDNLI